MDYVQVPRRLLEELIAASEDGLSSFVLPEGRLKNAVRQCTSKIREIAATAGLNVGSCSAAGGAGKRFC